MYIVKAASYRSYSVVSNGGPLDGEDAIWVGDDEVYFIECCAFRSIEVAVTVIKLFGVGGAKLPW
jgi:hypothetical protein